MTTLVDNFNRANGPLGTASGGFTWVFVAGPGDTEIVSNQAKQVNASFSSIYRTGGSLSTSDNYCQASIIDRGTNANTNIGVFCRVSPGGAGTGYLGIISEDAVYLFRVTMPSTFVQLGSSAAVSVSLPQVLKVQAVGTTVKVFWDGVEKISVDDSGGLSDGAQAGFRMGGAVGGTAVIFDDFEAGDVGGGGGGLVVNPLSGRGGGKAHPLVMDKAA